MYRIPREVAGENLSNKFHRIRCMHHTSTLFPSRYQISKLISVVIEVRGGNMLQTYVSDICPNPEDICHSIRSTGSSLVFSWGSILRQVVFYSVIDSL